MTTRFRTFIEQHVKEAGIYRSDLVKSIGYWNINKGLKRINSMIDHQIPPDDRFIEMVANTLSIDEDVTMATFRASYMEFTAKDRAEFRPHIFISIREKVYP